MATALELVPGTVYTRKELQKTFGLDGSFFFTGIFRPKGTNWVWLFITEQKGPGMTPYKDHLEGDQLEMDGQMKGRTDNWIIDHKHQGLELHVFYRKTETQFPGAGFRYEGQFEHVRHHGAKPAHFHLERVGSLEATVKSDLQALEEEEGGFEGARKQRYTNYYERNPKLRAAAIRIHGTTCQGCGFNFSNCYGERGAGFIEVHHIRPVSDLKESTKIDPRTDMMVVCSNCHRMIHRRKDDVLSPNELRKMVKQ